MHVLHHIHLKRFFISLLKNHIHLREKIIHIRHHRTHILTFTLMYHILILKIYFEIASFNFTLFIKIMDLIKALIKPLNSLFIKPFYFYEIIHN